MALNVVAWIGMLVAVGVMLLSLFVAGRKNGHLNPDRPIYLLLAVACLPAVGWFFAILHGWTGLSELWKLWSRIVIITPYLAIGMIVLIRLMSRRAVRK